MNYKNDSVATIELERGDSLKRRFIGDLHYGEPGADVEVFEQLMAEAYEDNRKTIIMGDMITSILPGDRRYEQGVHDTDLSEQQDYLQDIMAEYHDNIEIWLKGNHEDKLFRTHGDFIEKLCNRYDINYGGFQINVRYEKYLQGVGDLLDPPVSTLYLTHGTTSFNFKAGEDIRKPVNQRVKLKDNLRHICEADIYIQGHAHQGIMYTDPFELRLINNGGDKYEEHYRPTGEGKVYICIPSLLRTYHKGENYGARAGMKPTEVGAVDLDWDDKMNIKDIQIKVSHENKIKTKESYQDRRRVVV